MILLMLLVADWCLLPTELRKWGGPLEALQVELLSLRIGLVEVTTGLRFLTRRLTHRVFVLHFRLIVRDLCLDPSQPAVQALELSFHDLLNRLELLNYFPLPLWGT